ncbi:MAG: transposase [Bacteroidota bacterium]
MTTKIYYRRNLPHYQPPGATYFVTFRLAGSLPQEVVARLKEERAKAERLLVDTGGREEKDKINELRKRYFVRFDKLLDAARQGPWWLQNAEVAKVVSDAIHFRDGREYDLLAYCIMPNHVHLVMALERNGISLYKVLQSLKRFTAREANKILSRAGAFWQHESYDHVVRDGKELVRVIAYVLSNPEKAGLVGQWKSWRWSYTQMEI